MILAIRRYVNSLDGQLLVGVLLAGAGLSLVRRAGNRLQVLAVELDSEIGGQRAELVRLNSLVELACSEVTLRPDGAADHEVADVVDQELDDVRVCTDE